MLPLMPWQAFGQMSDENFGTIYVYLRQIPDIRKGVPEAPGHANQLKCRRFVSTQDSAAVSRHIPGSAQVGRSSPVRHEGVERHARARCQCCGSESWRACQTACVEVL
ncbi:MAG: hypothetical protein ACSHXI_20775 [Hoeflea sp.]|uniref:hypothetical protein n=1 Tax=Hoeflea sp. TaxID=1940281 RepID=UPI003EF9113B